ncbi:MULTISPECIES: DapH/DapD/GlmU-related protein [unclassified Burkholderia]|uniref:acyltransferase n=1 Tax=unclassified Burkholderia TaxID=2613784 RepID=UPI0015D0477D|nr:MULTISPECIES: acyltransferase [unclassified Burkholderia]
MKLLDGSLVENPSIDGLTVDFRSDGSEVIVHEGALFRNCRFTLGRDCKVEIQSTHKRGLINTVVDMSGIGVRKRLIIKSGTSIESARFAMSNESNLIVEIGKGCMLSSGITFRATDGHAIFDVSTGELLNKSKPISIGDNCWIGSEAVIMKGSVIPNNVIVGSRSLVAKVFHEENVVLAGVPAKIIRRNCGWSRSYVDAYVNESSAD